MDVFRVLGHFSRHFAVQIIKKGWPQKFCINSDEKRRKYKNALSNGFKSPPLVRNIKFSSHFQCSFCDFQEGIDATGSSPEITSAELQHDQPAKEPYADDDDDGSGVDPDESSGSGWGAGPGPDDEDGRGSGDSGRLLIEIPEDDEDFTPRHQNTFIGSSSTPTPVYSETSEAVLPVEPVLPAQPEEPTPTPTTSESPILRTRQFNVDVRE